MFTFIILLFILYSVFQSIYIFVPWTTANPKTTKILNREKRFTIIIPAFNEEFILFNTLEKIAAINYRNYEVIVVNDMAFTTDPGLASPEELEGLYQIPRLEVLPDYSLKDFKKLIKGVHAYDHYE